MGVIDITTKRNEENGSTVSMMGDNDNGHNINAVATKELENTSFQISITESLEDGPDKNNNGDNFRAANKVNIFSLRNQSNIAGGDFNIFWKHLQNEREVDSLEPEEISNPDLKHSDNYFYIGYDKKTNHQEYAISLSHNSYKTEQKWRSCRPTIFFKDELYELYLINPSIVADLVAGNSPTITTPEEHAAFNNVLPLLEDPNSFLDSCGDVNHDYTESTTLLELLNIYSTNNFRISNVLNLRKDRANSETYFDGEEELDTANIFSNAMWLAKEYLTLNIGFAYEKGEGMKGLFSPRIAMNFHIDPNNSIRIGASKSYRTTDIFEQRVNWRYKVSNIYPNYTGQNSAYFYASAKSNGSTDPEAIIDKELAYIGMFPKYGININSRIFKDKLYNLYSQKLQLYTFNPDSVGSVDLDGVEIELSYTPSISTQFNIGIAYLENETDYRIEKTQYSRWSGLFAVSHQFTPKWRTGFAYYGATNNDNTMPFNRYDLTISYYPDRLNSVSINGFIKYSPSTRIVYPTLPNPAQSSSDENEILLEDDNMWVGIEVNIGFNDLLK
jgi:iron complex outermembrane receptor protein